MRQLGWVWAILALVCGLVSAAAGEETARTPWVPRTGDWPTAFGNFQNTGYVDDPKCVPPFRLKWVAKIEGRTKCSAIVGDGRVFVQTVFGTLYAMDEQTGRI
jgi:outer membrane protein assembly factor BamB